MEGSEHSEGPYTVQCPECGARGPSDPSPEYAIYKWNRRYAHDVPATPSNERHH